ncbi:MAG: (d)CMP kinase [Elusimicrobia bacterium]|nr:(d)CMP kinase [Elusimicrobiota bacterium]
MSKRKNGIIVAIDGPAGVGKSTVGRMVAERLKYGFLSTGKMYRALAWKALQAGLDLADEDALMDLAGKLKWGFARGTGSELLVSIDGRALTREITTESVGKATSALALLGRVRGFMRDMQRGAGAEGGLVMEGRDIGTNVFPDAELKIYLDASPEARAERRFRQLSEQGLRAEYAQILDFIIKRDAQDSQRKNNPLKKAEDGFYLDSTRITRAQAVEEIVKLCRSAIEKAAKNSDQ